MELKEGARLRDTDGDMGTAFNIRTDDHGDIKFDMAYDKDFICRDMTFQPITDNPIVLGFEEVTL